MVDIELYVNYKQPLGLEEDLWSKAIEGSGGSSFISNEKNGLYTSDECFKMAYTDALSVACKSLGMGADVYWGDSKYQTNNQENEQKQTTKKVIKNTKEIDYHKLLQVKLKEMNINIPDFAKRHKLSMATPQEKVKDLLEKLTKGEIS